VLISILFLILAVIILFFGAEFTLTAAEKIGQRMGMSPFLIGILLIGFGTSLPEMFVAHIAGVQGQAQIAIGSLVGSNIANICLILGISALVTKLALATSVRKHLIIHLVLTLILVFVLTQSSLTLVSSAILLTLIVIYVFVIAKEMKNEEEFEKVALNKPIIVSAQLLIGFVMLYLGGELLVFAGTELAFKAGLSEYIVSAIFIAFGTSFPELVTALLAAFKKKDTDLIVGNIIGSNLFNCALVLGSLGIYNLPIKQNFAMELTALIIGGSLLLIACIFRQSIGKIMGMLFLSGYGYIVYQWGFVF